MNPAAVANRFSEAARVDINHLGVSGKIRVRGMIANHDRPSLEYAEATQRKFAQIGIHYELLQVERLALETAIIEANDDPEIHGIFIYFPVFHSEQDSYLRNLVDYRKDIEAGSIYWTRKLYNNDRLVDGDPSRKALLPCTPLAIVKLLVEIGVYAKDNQPLTGRTVTIFNRSEVIGRPLAIMLSNDGAKVYSFDVNGPMLFVDARPKEINISRTQALEGSDIVVTGVPSADFNKITAGEIRPDCVCLNFSSYSNFDEDITDRNRIYIPRVGPMTVAMCIRNTLRLYRNFHRDS